jgi:protein-tyrosine phosphatase
MGSPSRDGSPQADPGTPGGAATAAGGPGSNPSAVPGATNFRDAGGAPAAGGAVRRGVLWRSGDLSGLGDDGRRTVEELGIRTVVDLRQPIETEQHPDDLDGLGLDRHATPIFTSTHHIELEAGLEALYRVLLDTAGPRFADAIRPLCGPDALPAVVHCSAGKDRTGLTVALMLSAVGVADEDVAADYEVTEVTLTDEDHAAIVARSVQSGVEEQVVAAVMGSPAEAMRSTLRYLREQHGGAAAYLRAAGLTDDELEGLRRSLVG